ncbi:molybdopterin-binding protein [Seleniivibrio woodruffii]|uniref:Molybdopterin molybdenumtransferase n=1 Tax=Seleniivibrio woodruffii TaxID=1078050 RepID=A0A4R1K5M1_9BACT|nr:molybdopterin-binding protein [Seleniivibrio woodruffii]TCK58339.1 molybdenum cofactor synthesis domain-containing protein [Seleniivibrio woodruffii]TVZ36713.1 molybdenum cofactor synthesis domain-containing protein [Seleniivibrio woodruffii]
MRRVSIEEAVGQVLAYDITEVNIVEGFKHRAYKRGHIIAADEVEHLKSLGRRSIFIEDGNSTGVHEDDAAKIGAPLIAGSNIRYDAESSEGKVSFYAEIDGLFKVDEERLFQINNIGIPSLPTIHNNMGVEKGKQVAAFRIIPLVCEQSVMDRVTEILDTPIIEIKPYVVKTAALLITGSEVYEGRIKDGFRPKLEPKLNRMGVEVIDYRIVPDEADIVTAAVQEMAAKADMLITTGGTSVDPDDITAQALLDAGVTYEMKGSQIQPGNNLTMGYYGDKPVCAIPAAALHFSATSFDILLPRILAGEKIGKRDMALLAHGGLCHFCKKCVYPICPFGRG